MTAPTSPQKVTFRSKKPGAIADDQAGKERLSVSGTLARLRGMSGDAWRNDRKGERAKMQLALREAIRASQELGKPDPRLVNNLAVLGHLEGHFNDARVLYEAALTDAAGAGTSIGIDSDGVSTTILYNLARVYEDQGDIEMAREAYEKLLTRHPEYVDGASS